MGKSSRIERAAQNYSKQLIYHRMTKTQKDYCGGNSGVSRGDISVGSSGGIGVMIIVMSVWMWVMY